MLANWSEFEGIVIVILNRYFAQNSAAPPAAAELKKVSQQLAQVIARRGLPRPLGPDERGVPGGMPDQECAAVVEQVAAGASSPLLVEAVRQLVKACSYPEFKDCRDSFRELARDGSCRRQELARVKGRVSGTHCVDCPHWVALPPQEHAAFLAREWKLGAEHFLAHQPTFLPEDFRALRLWLHGAARGTDQGR